MPFTGREKAFCVLEYARLQSNKTVQYALVREFKNSCQQQCRFGHGTKNSKRKVGSGQPKTSEETVERVPCLRRSAY